MSHHGEPDSVSYRLRTLITLLRLLSSKTPTHEIDFFCLKHPHLNTFRLQASLLPSSPFHTHSLSWDIPRLGRDIDSTILRHAVPEPEQDPLHASDPELRHPLADIEELVGHSDLNGSDLFNLGKEIAGTLPSSRSRLSSLKPDANSIPSEDPLVLGKVISDFWGKVWSTAEEEISTDRVTIMPSLLLHLNYRRRIDPTLLPSAPSLDHVHQAVRESGNSGSGPDGLPFAAFRALSTIAVPVLHNALLFLTTPITDEQASNFNVANLHLIPKKPTDLIEDTRPICVNNTDSRIIAKAVVFAIDPAVQSFIGPQQKLFLRGRHFTDHIRDFNRIFYEAIDKSQPYYILFTDNARAFDSIYHSYISFILAEQGFPPWLLHIISNLLRSVMVHSERYQDSLL